MDDQKAYAIVGHSMLRPDAREKVRGRAVYVADFRLPGMLFARVLWSDRPHARILHIDTRQALDLPGVYTVVTADDAPNTRYGVYLKDQLIFARGKVRHIGEPVAAVAAESEAIAEKAIEKIVVQYEELPAIFEPIEAMKPGAPLIHPDLESYEATYPKIVKGNVCLYTRLSMGDTEKGFEDADYVFEDTFKTQPMYQGYLEPRGAVASFDFNDKLTVWTSNQQILVCQAELATALEMPMTQVRVIGTAIGGAFGGKLKTSVEPIVALLAKKSGRPVRLVLTREEDFIASRARAPYILRLKTGVKANGKITAKSVELIADCGGYSDHVVGTMGLAVSFSQGPYKIPNAEAKGYCVYTNNPNYSCMRAYGVHQMCFATESQMDIIASKIGMDPAEFRRRNLAEDGDVLVTTQPLRSVTVDQTMAQVLKACHWEEKRKASKQRGVKNFYGIGMANTILNMGLLSSAAIVKINEDGTASVLTGAVDLGTGNHTALAQIAAEELGMKPNDVNIAAVDSDSSPYDLGQIASRTIFDCGNAIKLAANDARRQLFATADEVLGAEGRELRASEGNIYVRDEPDKKISIRDLMGYRLYFKGGPIIGRAGWLGKLGFDHLVGEGYPQPPSVTFVFGTHVAEVEVDVGTGQVKVERITAAHDVGRAINPLGVAAQIEGGVVQGMGYALYEEMQIHEGVVQNPDFLNYRMPTILDAPEIVPIILEIPEEYGPFGAKGIGEPTNMGPPPAIANAIYNAVGVRVKELPITPERLLHALDDKKTREA